MGRELFDYAFKLIAKDGRLNTQVLLIFLEPWKLQRGRP